MVFFKDVYATSFEIGTSTPPTSLTASDFYQIHKEDAVADSLVFRYPELFRLKNNDIMVIVEKITVSGATLDLDQFII